MIKISIFCISLPVRLCFCYPAFLFLLIVICWLLLIFQTVHLKYTSSHEILYVCNFNTCIVKFSDQTTKKKHFSPLPIVTIAYNVLNLESKKKKTASDAPKFVILFLTVKECPMHQSFKQSYWVWFSSKMKRKSRAEVLWDTTTLRYLLSKSAKFSLACQKPNNFCRQAIFIVLR